MRLFVRLVCTLIVSGSLLGASPALAAGGRSIVIDIDSYEVVGDAIDGDGTSLPFAINYGAGLQQDLTINLQEPVYGVTTAQVGLAFTNSPSDSLYASLFTSGFSTSLPAVFLSNDQQHSTPLNPVTEASTFNFGTMFAPIGPGLGGACTVTGISTHCYGILSGTADFVFTDLSATGVAGDFGLSLLCTSACYNIGFNFAGLNFDAATFDPNNAPSQLVSYRLERTGSSVTYGSFDFIFRNVAAVPEPQTWAMMLLGFLMIGIATRRHRALTAQAA